MDGLTVHRVERKNADILFGGQVPAIEVHVKFDDGESMFLSRLQGEDSWIIDAYFGANGFPHFCNGFGSRVTRLHTVADDVSDAIDAAVCEAGLVERIAIGEPLGLA